VITRKKRSQTEQVNALPRPHALVSPLPLASAAPLRSPRLASAQLMT